MDARDERPGIWRTWRDLLTDAGRMLRTGGLRLIGVVLLFQLAILLVFAPLIVWLFREAVRAAGMTALDLGTLHFGGALPVSLGLIVVICTLAFWLAALQFTVIVVALRRARLGLPIVSRAVLRELGAVVRKLLRPSSLPLLAYLFLLLPLSGFGFTTVLAQGIAVPPFISGELMKGTVSAVAWIVLMVVLALLNIRLALTLPVFGMTDASGGRAMRVSWRLTRGRAVLSLVGAAVTILVAAGIATAALVVVTIIPTAIADDAAPAAAPVVAAFSLGAAQTIGLVLTSLVTVFIGAVLVSFLVRFKDRLPAGVRLTEPQEGGQPRLGRRTLVPVFIATLVAAAVALGAGAVPTMHKLAQHPETLVLAHRGFTDGGVENTICGLEAASAAGADLVEMDVMQSKDGEFVAMHDANLSRLAGIEAQVKDLTLAELTALTVSAAGHECAIPSFADYVVRAAEIGMPLLIEIKLGGADTPDHVTRLIAELESLDALHGNIYHTLDAPSVAELKRARPDLTVGYIMPLAAVDVPDTPADFIVVEEWSATQEVQDAAHRAGLGFMVWTVNDATGMREHLRRGTDGIITDHPDLAIDAREEMLGETGISDVLLDALTRFVVVF